jgi:hypothetical protein
MGGGLSNVFSFLKVGTSDFMQPEFTGLTVLVGDRQYLIDKGPSQQ